ncbi:putative arabinose efflux permease, MFS family [Balamuthia mandrillaris]
MLRHSLDRCLSCLRLLFPGKKVEDRTRFYHWWALLLLIAVNLLREADQWALPTLQASGLQCSSCPSSPSTSEDVAWYRNCQKQCLSLSDVQMGFLSGPAFTLSSVLASIPLGWLADLDTRVHRVWILFGGVLVWSGATVAAAFAGGFWGLALSRVLLGLGGATVNPTAYSLLADYFHPQYRAFILALFSATIYLGELVGLVTGFISQAHSWRLAFLLLGVPGFFCAFILGLTLREPVRGLSERWAKEVPTTIVATKEGEHDAEQKRRTTKKKRHKKRLIPTDIKEEERAILATETTLLTATVAEGRAEEGRGKSYSFLKRFLFLLQLPAFVGLCCAAAIRNLGGYALGGWLQVFLVRVHGLKPADFATWLIVIIPVGGGLGATIGGFLADRWFKVDHRGKAWLIACSQAFAAPLIAGFLLVEPTVLAFAFLFASFIFAEMWYGPSTAIVQDLLPPSIRGLGTAIYFIVASLGALAPLIVGALNNFFNDGAPYSDQSSSASQEEQGEDTVLDPTYSMLMMVAGMYVLSVPGFFLVSAFIKHHRERAWGLLQKESLRDIINEKERNDFFFEYVGVNEEGRIRNAQSQRGDDEEADDEKDDTTTMEEEEEK